MEKICENCKYEEIEWCGEPCHHCDVNTFDKWEPKEDD